MQGVRHTTTEREHSSFILLGNVIQFLNRFVRFSTRKAENGMKLEVCMKAMEQV